MSQPDPSSRPLEEQLPPDVRASPADMPYLPPGQVQWWMPGWRDAARFVGWRWVLLVPAALLLLALAICPWYPALWRVFWALGWKPVGLLAAIPAALAAHVIRCAARARSEPFCIHCGYNLTGLPDGHTCPECGRPFRLRVIEEYRRDPHWFIERWRMQQSLPAPTPPMTTPPNRRPRKRRDGT